jgi:ABC-type uncharacterized transport system substrate-binding protein
LSVRVKRRVLVGALAAAIPAAAWAQAPKKIVVGLLSWWPASMEPVYATRLREGLRACGYVEGRNLELLTAFTDGDVGRTRAAAKDFVDRGVDVMVVTATPAVAIAKQVTEGTKIPIVMAPVADPIVPVVSHFPVFAVAGGLLTYGIDDRARMDRAAYFGDRIVKGASPADLPIELPTDYALAINPKAAAAFGLTVPPTVLYGATEVIE